MLPLVQEVSHSQMPWGRRMPPSASEGSAYAHKSLAVPRGAVENGPKHKQKKKCKDFQSARTCCYGRCGVAGGAHPPHGPLPLYVQLCVVGKSATSIPFMAKWHTAIRHQAFCIVIACMSGWLTKPCNCFFAVFKKASHQPRRRPSPPPWSSLYIPYFGIAMPHPPFKYL